MEIATSRFGKLAVSPQDVLQMEQGLIGLRHCRRWVVLADTQRPQLGWLQCLDDEHVSLGIASPRRFVPDFQLRLDRRDLQPLRLATPYDAQVAAIVSRCGDGWSLNLRAPLVINVELRLGRQVIAKDPLPTRYVLPLDAQMRLTA